MNDKLTRVLQEAVDECLNSPTTQSVFDRIVAEKLKKVIANLSEENL